MWEAISFVFTGGILVLSGVLFGFGLARASNPKPEPMKYTKLDFDGAIPMSKKSTDEIIAESMKRHPAGKRYDTFREEHLKTTRPPTSKEQFNEAIPKDDVQIVKDMFYADDGTTPTRAIPKQK